MDAGSTGATHSQAAINFDRLAGAIEREANRSTKTGTIEGRQVSIGPAGNEKPVKFEMLTNEMVQQFMKMTHEEQQERIGNLHAKLQEVKSNPNFSVKGQQTNAKIQLSITVPMLVKQLKNEAKVKDFHEAHTQEAKMKEANMKAVLKGGNPKPQTATTPQPPPPLPVSAKPQTTTTPKPLPPVPPKPLTTTPQSSGVRSSMEPTLQLGDRFHKNWDSFMDKIVNDTSKGPEQKVSELKLRLSTMKRDLAEATKSESLTKPQQSILQGDIQRCLLEIGKLIPPPVDNPPPLPSNLENKNTKGPEIKNEQAPKHEVQEHIHSPNAKAETEAGDKSEVKKDDEIAVKAYTAATSDPVSFKADAAKDRLGNIVYSNKELREKLELLHAKMDSIDDDIATFKALNKDTDVKPLLDVKAEFEKASGKLLAERAEREDKMFSGSMATDLKNSMVELYAAEDVFMKKLAALKGDPSLTEADSAKLDELISNTNTILQGLGSAFSQVGAQAQAELRTLKQDFSNSISFQSQRSETAAYHEKLKELIKIQGEIGQVSGGIMYAKNETDKATAETRKKELQNQFANKMVELGKIDHLDIQNIVSKYNRIGQLEDQCANLPAIPHGLFESMRETFNDATVKKQYELLGHFATKLEAMKEALDPNFNKYQELGNKLTRYPMLLEAIQGKIPLDSVPVELINIQKAVNENLVAVNSKK